MAPGISQNPWITLLASTSNETLSESIWVGSHKLTPAPVVFWGLCERSSGSGAALWQRKSENLLLSWRFVRNFSWACDMKVEKPPLRLWDESRNTQCSWCDSKKSPAASHAPNSFGWDQGLTEHRQAVSDNMATKKISGTIIFFFYLLDRCFGLGLLFSSAIQWLLTSEKALELCQLNNYTWELHHFMRGEYLLLGKEEGNQRE